MAYFNPFQMATPIQNPRPQTPQNTTPQIDPQQFRQFAMTLNDQSLLHFAQLARQQGISEKDIQDGINFIKRL